MEDYGYSTISSRHWPKNGRYFAVPQRCKLEVCHLPDWHNLNTYRDRFSSSSFADSESEEEMSKRVAGRGAGAPLSSPPKMRRGGTSHRREAVQGHRGGHLYGMEGHCGQLPPVSGASRSKPRPQQFSHSSSDDEVFIDGMGIRRHNLPLPFQRHPPPFPEAMDGFTPHHDYHHADPYGQQQQRCQESRFHNGGDPAYRHRRRMRERPHSLPPPGHDASRGGELPRGHEPFRGCEHSRGRELSRGQGQYPEGVLVDRQTSGESSDDGSLRPAVSVSDDFNFMYHYGFSNSLGSSKDSKTSSASSSSSHRQTPGPRGCMSARVRNQGPNRGAYPPRSANDKWRQHDVGMSGGVPLSLDPSPGQKGGRPRSLHLGIRPSYPMTHIGHAAHREPLKGHDRGGDNPQSMTMAEKLHRFMLFVRHENSNRINDIQTIENAITGCHLDLKTLYEAEDVGVYQGRHTFSGKLSLSGIFLARAVGQVKRELKHECYKLALQVLRTKTVCEILKQHDIGIKAIRDKFEECSAADTEASVSEAVVNLASAAPIAVAMETVATTEERWQDFINYLKGLNPDMGNTISRIELAISGSRCGLERVYTDTTMMDQYQGKPGFQGSLTLGGVLQAQGQGGKKKEAKQRTYDLAYSRFTSLELGDILKGVSPQSVEEFKKERSVHVVVKEIRTAEHIKKFELFIDRIKDSSVREGPVTLLDLTANQLQLLITCMYKKVEEGETIVNLCQLFVGDILISEGEGRQKKEAQADAYSKAYEILISTPVDTLISESHRLNKEELQGADVHDVVIKGQIKKEESNLPRLRQQFLNVEESLSEKASEGMVVVEHQDWVHDRKRHAFCILQNSALMNIMLLKWCTEIETGFFTCRVQLQGEEVGVAKAHSRQQARNLASADALFKMYETQPVLRIISGDQSGSWVTRGQLVERMGAMEEGGEFQEVDEEWTAQLQRQQQTCQSSEGDESMSGADSTPAELTDQHKGERKMERRLRVVACKVAEEYQQRGDILDELVFAPDMPHSVRRHLTTAVAKMGLRCTQCQKDGKIYLTIHFRTRVDKVVEEMKKRGITETSRFVLVEDRSSLPCHADVAEEIEIARTLTRQDRIAARTALQPQSADKEIRDAATGNSMNGSLFEETMEGFVTARSYMISDHANASIQPPRIQSTPTQAQTPPKKQTTPAEEVYAKFARAMMASGIGQTLVPMECSTPVSNILVNPPTSDTVGGRPAAAGGAPVIKNILMSPPGKAGGLSVTLSSPMKNFFQGSSAASSSFPQPDFSDSPRRKEVEGWQSHQSEPSSCCSTLSPSSMSCRPRPSGSSSLFPVSASSFPCPLSKRSSPPLPVIVPSACVTVVPGSGSSVVVGHTVPVSQDLAARTGSDGPLASGQPSQNGYHNGYPPHTLPATTYTQSVPAGYAQTLAASYPVGYPCSSVAGYAGGGGGGGGYFANPYSQPFQGGAWQPQVWQCIDPSAPHAIQMSPVAGQFHSYGNGVCTKFSKPQDSHATTAAVYVENEVPAHALHGRRWNHNPV